MANTITPPMAPAIMAVSYTHLDVYKRQILQRVQAMPFESLEKMELYITEKLSGAFPKISFQEKEGQEAVSYTHLDVYKRQL